MTIESTLPWVSAVAAIGAAAVAGGAPRREERWLKVLALGALAVFAYFRWIAPAAVPLGLTLQAIAEAALPRAAGERWRRWWALFPIAGWGVLANLFWSSGEGRVVFLNDPVRAGLAVVLLIGAGWGVRRSRLLLAPIRFGGGLAAAALALMLAAALSLDWALWPAMAGTAVIAAAEMGRLRLGDRPLTLAWKSLWALQFAGYGAVSYAFLR